MESLKNPRANQVPTSPLADDITTAPSGPVCLTLKHFKVSFYNITERGVWCFFLLLNNNSGRNSSNDDNDDDNKINKVIKKINPTFQ